MKTLRMKVMVANEYNLVSKYEALRFTWQMGKHEFPIDIRVLPMGSYVLVLEVDWLAALDLPLLTLLNSQLYSNRQGIKWFCMGIVNQKSIY